MKTKIIEGLSQARLDEYLAARQYEALYWPAFFPIKDVNSLDAKTLIGAEGSRVAASVISYNAKAPLAGRKAIDVKYFDIPKIAISRNKDEIQLIEYETLRARQGELAVLKDYFNDIDFCFDSVQARMEWFALQALSLTKTQLSVTNNPLGIVEETVVDFGMPAANKKFASVVWATTATKAIADFTAVIAAGDALGITFSKALMHPSALALIVASTEFQTAAKSYVVGQPTVLGRMGIDVANAIMVSLGLIPISVIKTSVGIEAKSGVITQVNPWDANHVLFIPQDQLGNMYNGPIAEEILKPAGVLMQKRGNVNISSKDDWNPVSVVTKGECNAFPSWPTIDRCMSLYIASDSAWA